jgi:hypothetical protein
MILKSGGKTMKRAIVMLVAAGAAGCSVNYPQNADEFRRDLPGSFMGSVQSFETNRPLRDIGRTFQSRAPECLSVKVRTVSQTSGSYQNILAAYKPTVVVTEKRAEIHLQRHYERGVLTPGKEPEGGHYMLVADATPIDRNKTRVVIYAPKAGADAVIRAVSAWAKGESTGCPDMTKN